MRAASPAALAGQMNDIALAQLADLLQELEASEEHAELAIQAVTIVLGVLEQRTSATQYRAILAEVLPLLANLSHEARAVTADAFAWPS
jgi:hypothetical protein